MCWAQYLIFPENWNFAQIFGGSKKTIRGTREHSHHQSSRRYKEFVNFLPIKFIPLRQRKVRKSSVLGHSPFFRVSGILTLLDVGPEAVEELDEPLLLFLTLTGLCKAVKMLWPCANFRCAWTLGLLKWRLTYYNWKLIKVDALNYFLSHKKFREPQSRMAFLIDKQKVTVDRREVFSDQLFIFEALKNYFPSII